MHNLMENPHIFHSYMTYLMEEEEERKRERGGGERGGGYNLISRQSMNFDGG